MMLPFRSRGGIGVFALVAMVWVSAVAVAQPLPLLPDPTPPPAPAAGTVSPSAPGASTANPPTRAGTAAVSATVSMDVLDDSRTLNRGDIVNFRIVEDRDPPVSLQITDSGDMEIPYVGRLRAEGKTPRQLAFEIKSLLERDYYHNATVILAIDMEGQRSPGIIYVTGMVGAPGPMPIPPNETFTVSKAILRAGGFATFANQRRVRLTRTMADGETKVQTIDVKEIIEKARPDLDVEVLPNDLILVPERLINF